MKTLILMALLSFNVFAMRCGNVLIEEGNSMQKVLTNCGIPDSRYENNVYGDRVTLIYLKNGATYALSFIDGTLYTESFQR